MTTVAAIQYHDRVELAADAKVTSNSTYLGDVDKIFTNGPVTFGCSGLLRAINLLSAMDIPALGESDYTESWLTNELMPALLARFKDNSSLVVKDGSATHNNSLIVVVRGEAFYVGTDFGWFRAKSGFYAVGSGNELALGALHAGVSAEKAVEIASLIDHNTGGAIQKVTVR